MNARKISVLRLLSDGEIHSVTSIAAYIQCSTTEIHNTLRHINIPNIILIVFNNKGYWWKNPFNWLNEDLIFKNLVRNIVDKVIYLRILDHVDSTNNYLLLNELEKRHDINDCISVVAAELQTNGRGRWGRSWHSGLGESLTFSIGWLTSRSISCLTGLSLVIGIAIIRVFNSLAIKNVYLKWPNDILFNNKKLGGILIELRKKKTDSTTYCVIGIGINFRLSDNIKCLVKQNIIDLFTITGVSIDRNLILGRLLSELHKVLIDFEKYSFNYFMEEWISYHGFEGKKVNLFLPNDSVIEGIASGVDPNGALVLLTEEGKKIFNVGDISLRLK